jgi:periplasmic divalent cation tolerance protein
MGSYILCLVTIDDIGKAGEMARALVEKEIVACVNIIPEIRSIYRWKGAVCDDPECLMILKTKEELFPKLQTVVRELHPYEVPEIISLTIDQGLPEYLRWIDDCTGQQD